MFRNKKNSKKQGDVGLGIAISYFTIKGYTVCIPLTDSQDYDLIVEFNECLNRIQVKTTFYKTKYGSYQVGLKVCGGNRTYNTVKKFDKLSCDYLFIVTEEDNRYLIPTSVFNSLRSNINLCKKYDEFKVL